MRERCAPSKGSQLTPAYSNLQGECRSRDCFGRGRYVRLDRYAILAMAAASSFGRSTMTSCPLGSLMIGSGFLHRRVACEPYFTAPPTEPDRQLSRDQIQGAAQYCTVPCSLVCGG
jgi:hypothetical protein